MADLDRTLDNLTLQYRNILNGTDAHPIGFTKYAADFVNDNSKKPEGGEAYNAATLDKLKAFIIKVNKKDVKADTPEGREEIRTFLTGLAKEPDGQRILDDWFKKSHDTNTADGFHNWQASWVTFDGKTTDLPKDSAELAARAAADKDKGKGKGNDDGKGDDDTGFSFGDIWDWMTKNPGKTTSRLAVAAGALMAKSGNWMGLVLIFAGLFAEGQGFFDNKSADKKKDSEKAPDGSQPPTEVTRVQAMHRDRLATR